MIVVDTTVLVYATGAEHELRESARELVAAIAAGQLEATTTIEVIQEFAHARARRRGRADAAALARDYAELLSPLLPVETQQLRHGLELFEANEDLGAFDAVLAAAALDADADAIVSADQGFAALVALPHVNCDAAGVASLLD